MKKLISALYLTVVLMSCKETKKDMTTKNETDDQKADTNWISLFDNVSLKGWHNYGKTGIGEAWKIADGTFYLDTTKKDGWQTVAGGDIVTDEEFENFHFQIDWKIAAGGNSGIIFNINEDTAKYEYAWQTGPEMQVLDNALHPDSKIIKHRAGDLYDLITSSPETVKVAGEWNHAEIISNQGKLEFFLNGTKVVSTSMWDEPWKKMIAESKFKEWADFGTYKKGHIALQDHGNTVWYKNVKIKRL